MTITHERLKQLITEISANNSQSALKEVYLTFYSKIFNIALYYVKSETTAEEIVSDTFFAVWEQRSKLQDVYNFDAYLCQIVRNLSVSHLRRKASSVKEMENTELSPLYETIETPETEFISMELMDKLNRAVEDLPDRCRLVFKLIREENLKYKEVAAMLCVSTKTVEAHMRLAISRLRMVIEKG